MASWPLSSHTARRRGGRFQRTRPCSCERPPHQGTHPGELSSKRCQLRRLLPRRSCMQPACEGGALSVRLRGWGADRFGPAASLMPAAASRTPRRFVQVVLGLWHVHSKGILHRDLKVGTTCALLATILDACGHSWSLAARARCLLCVRKPPLQAHASDSQYAATPLSRLPTGCQHLCGCRWVRTLRWLGCQLAGGS